MTLERWIAPPNFCALVRAEELRMHSIEVVGNDSPLFACNFQCVDVYFGINLYLGYMYHMFMPVPFGHIDWVLIGTYFSTP